MVQSKKLYKLRLLFLKSVALASVFRSVAQCYRLCRNNNKFKQSILKYTEKYKEYFFERTGCCGARPPAEEPSFVVIHISRQKAPSSHCGLLNQRIKLIAVDFEVFCIVESLAFSEYTKIEADRLNIRGWCQNTVQGTVKGHIEGPSESVTAMLQWLRKKGSPKSIIERVEFGEPKEIRSYNCQGFRIIQED